MQEDNFEPRPNDFLVEPLFAPLEPQAEPTPRRWYARLFTWLLRRG